MDTTEFEALEAFKNNISSMISADTQAAEDNTASPKTIYHYTDVKGALGILETGELWFTERTHLNDPVEIQHGLRIAHELFAQAIRNNTGLPHDAVSHFKEQHDSGLTRFGFWVFSASLNDDDLGQWRAYADDGRGVCLAFSMEHFDMKELAKHHIRFALNSRKFRVNYCEQHLRKSMSRYIGSGVETLGKLRWDGRDPRDAWHMENYFWLLLNDGVFVNSTLYKHKAYETENEYRLLIIGERDKIAEESDRHHVREQNGEIVGYLKVPLPSWRKPGVLTHIRVGPAAPDQLKDQIRIALKKLRIPLQLEIDKSCIPYRSAR